MREAGNSAIRSYLDWWAEAGVTEPVQDLPCTWLAPTTAAPMPANDVAPAPHLAVAAQAPEPDLPADLAAFDHWLADSAALPGAGWSPARVLPTGPAEASLMVLADMPDMEDIASGRLLSGASGELFDAMMAAIGRRRGELRLGSIALTRPPGGRWDDASAARLRAIALHHVDVARPKRLLLLGQLTCRLLSGEEVAPDGNGLRNVNHYGATMAATAIHHPRVLLKQPGLKRGAWTALKMLREPG